MDKNAFGKLVRDHREQRRWTQDELAERWGFTREYVSLIERGKRKLDKPEQTASLAEILGISEEQLTHVGKNIPFKRSSVQHSAERDDMLLEALLEPVQTNVKTFWLVQDHGVLSVLTDRLSNLEKRLSGVLSQYRGQFGGFYQPALRMLASVHELLGRQAVERTATQEAMTHFQGMYDIAEELRDNNLLTLAMIFQAAMSRRQARFELSFRRLEIAEKHARDSSRWLQCLLSKTYARNYSVYGDEHGFLYFIDRAVSLADNIDTTIDTIINGLDKVGILEEKAQGYTRLWKSKEALEIYQEIDKMVFFRSPRQQSSYHIAKAETYFVNNNPYTGIEHALTGLRIAEKLQSIRYVMRLRQMCDRLKAVPIAGDPSLKDLYKQITDVWHNLN